MKKALTILGTLLVLTLQAQRGEQPIQNTILLQNMTDEEFTVCIHETNHDSSHHVSLEPGEIRSFLAGSVARINGPLHFAQSRDMNNKKYHYYEVTKIFPLMFYTAQTAKIFGIKKNDDNQYVITPGDIPVVVKETTREAGF